VDPRLYISETEAAGIMNMSVEDFRAHRERTYNAPRAFSAETEIRTSGEARVFFVRGSVENYARSKGFARS
jgi:hypothetical protein